MSAAATFLPDLAELADAHASRLERQLAILGQIAEIGLTLAQGLERQSAEADAAQAASTAVAYGRVARAVRLTIALQSKLVADANRPTPADDAHAELRAARRAQVTRVVRRVIAEDGGDPMESAWRKVEAAERLEHDDIYGDILARPASEIVAEVCQDLGVRPDWARLAAEAWARDEIEGGAPGAPLARRSVAASFIPSPDPDDPDEDDEDFDDDS